MVLKLDREFWVARRVAAIRSVDDHFESAFAGTVALFGSRLLSYWLTFRLPRILELMTRSAFAVTDLYDTSTADPTNGSQG